MKKNVVFFGDSLTVGEGNNDVSFADYFSCNTDYYCTICGVSGSCFGDYSIYPVFDNLLTMIDDHSKAIRQANLIVIEFGLNDTAAVATGYVDIKKVYVSIVRAVDYIKQLNPDVNIIFINPSNEDSIQYTEHIHNYVKYLNFDYFRTYDYLSVATREFMQVHQQIVDFIRSINYNNINMISVNNISLAKDGIHFDESGHRSLAKQLELFINENNLIN